MCDLHRKVSRWYSADFPDASWESRAELIEYHGDEADVPGEIRTFEVCEECARMERNTLTEQAGDEWGYLESLWPCRSATVLGMA